MSSQFGKLFRISLYGESHGNSVGCIIEGLPPGFKVDLGFVHSRLDQRKPDSSGLTTSRNETDEYEVLSGLYDGKTTGTPLSVRFANKDQRSSDYRESDMVFRPGHADYTGFIKYNGANDPRGGGHFSGRLTAPIVFAGAIAEQILISKGIEVVSQLLSVGALQGKTLEEMNEATVRLIDGLKFAIHPDYSERFLEEIRKTGARGDSIGGVVETVITGVKPGIGEPFFDSLESTLAHGLFSIPGVKGVSFGAGFGLSRMNGSVANDRFLKNSKGTVITATNRSGGINGGISNGMPIKFDCAVKPTPSIAMAQETLDFGTMENSMLSIKGRHDPCVALRAVHVVRAVAAMVICDQIFISRGVNGSD
ncbi:MAG: chorismate synthase [Clostridia bacterium]|nr:chorismate synthase [Clostridia bacterium]